MLREPTVALAVAVAALAPATPARAQAYACPQAPSVAQVSTQQTVEDQMFDPERLAVFATGAGIRVAVIDSGVDASHPQLRGRVEEGRDFLHDNPDGRQDCVGHGTAVAGIIAARTIAGVGPRGLAPDATIVPIRVSERLDSDQPAVPQPGVGQPAVPQPGSPQPGVGEPASPQPGVGQPGVQQPGLGQPGGLQPGAGQPGAQQPGLGQPGIPPPGVEQPGVHQPPARQPGTPQPGSAGRVGEEPVSPARFAAAIDWAVAEGGADVLNLSVIMTVDHPRVRAAVARAVAAGVVVVAAAGNHGRPGEANPAPYPASYPDVLGVGAVGPDGMAAAFSQRGDYVDVLAPGVGVTIATRGSGHLLGTGTSYATPFVAATAALVKQRFPALVPAQVIRRILATADPAPGGDQQRGGFGVLNPYRAVTESLGPSSRPAPAPTVRRTEDPAAVAAAERRAHAQTRSLIFAAGGAGVILVLLAATATIPRGRRRGWRPPDAPGAAR